MKTTLGLGALVVLLSVMSGTAAAADKPLNVLFIVADDLYDVLVQQRVSFWDHVYPLFLARDITRHDVRELVRRGLS